MSDHDIFIVDFYIKPNQCLEEIMIISYFLKIILKWSNNDDIDNYIARSL